MILFENVTRDTVYSLYTVFSHPFQHDRHMVFDNNNFNIFH